MPTYAKDELRDEIVYPGGPARIMKAVTIDGSDIFADGPAFGLLVNADGTANLTFLDGSTLDAVPLQKGYNPIVVKAVRVGGSATGIFALR